MVTLKEKRKQFMETLCHTLDILDPTKTNSKRYHEMLDPMSDKDFDTWATDFLNDEKQQFYLEIIEYDKSRELKYDNIDKAAKYLGVPLYERVYVPYINRDPDNIVVTPYPVPVGYIHEKRMMQTLEKKNSGSTSIHKRNQLTGQVTGDDKNGRNSDVETYSMLAIGAEKGLQEFMGPRADDDVARRAMARDIANNGYVSLADLPNDPLNKTSMNTLDTYFIMQGFKTNLIKGGDILPLPDDIKETQSPDE